MSDENDEPMTEADIELDALMARASASMLRTLDEQVDTEARLREILTTAGVATERYAADPSSAEEVPNDEGKRS